MRLSDVIGLEVRTESGRRVGHVHDLRGEFRDDGLAVTALVVGGMGVLERLGLRGMPRTERTGGPVIAWDGVVRVDRRGVVLRDDAAE